MLMPGVYIVTYHGVRLLAVYDPSEGDLYPWTVLQGSHCVSEDIVSGAVPVTLPEEVTV